MIAFFVLGLPAHPLIVHGAVVGIPLASLGVLVYALRPAWRRSGCIPVLVTVVLAWVLALLAGSTGESLEHALPRDHFIEDHTRWAGYLGVAVHVLAASAMIMLVVDLLRTRRSAPLPSGARTLRTVALPVAVLAAVASLVMVGIVGHLGSRAAWHGSPGASKSMQAEQ